MASNGPSKTMSLPATPPMPLRVQQSSIRSFFQRQPPSYTPPPSSQNTASNPTHALTTIPRLTPPPSINQLSIAIPQQAVISPIDSSHIQSLRRINALLLPVNYPDSFYNKILDPSSTPSFSRVILWQDTPSNPPKVVGGIVCRLDPSLAPDSTPTAPKFLEGSFDVYIQSLSLLSPYRGHGLATAALKSVVDAATEQIRFRIEGLYAHVWTENKEALEWYAARGFQKDEPVINGYYWRLKPDSAWILRKRFGVGDHLSHPPPSQIAATGSEKPTTAVPSRTMSTPASRPAIPSAPSFQDRRPDREWNDLPEDVLGSSLLKPPTSKHVSAASSRSSSRSSTKKRKERLYPAAAFGS